MRATGHFTQQGEDTGSAIVVDTAYLVMGDRYQPSMRASYRKLIVIAGLGIALAADAIADEVNVPEGAVTWRDDTCSRPWLAGTWSDQRCAMVGLQGMVEQLMELES
ncbi:hypothetical protein [Litorivicinus lipolyticus]|uniref:hypothetical protein n=1 Tax=Litorivicinus lipolyticus TaxID=418701 RepID=UPI003B58BDBD